LVFEEGRLAECLVEQLISELMKPLRIAFLGTPEFAAVCLDQLMDSQHEIVGVVTAPDRPAGRGHKLRPSAVKERALAAELPLLQPLKLRDPEFLAAWDEWNPDIAVVVAFRMMPEVLWNRPPMGTINLHASVLPQLRGAAPIQWAILHGLKETGVSTFALQHEIDTGDVLGVRRVPIDHDMDSGQLHDLLLEAGKELLVKTLNSFASQTIERISQEDLAPLGTPLLSAPKLDKDNTRIPWDATAARVHDHVRGLHPFPTSWTLLPGTEEPLKILKGSDETGHHTKSKPGSIRISEKLGMFVTCGDGREYEILELKPPGKRAMSASDWLRGLAPDQRPEFFH
jgi:methionyl-tRNA formyltransferase